MKSICAIYCLLVLIIFIVDDITITCIIICLLLLESFLGILIYVLSFFALIFHKKFFVKWLKWMSKWYFSGIIKCDIHLEDNILKIHMRDLNSNDSESSPPDIIHDLRDSSKDSPPEEHISIKNFPQKEVIGSEQNIEIV